MHFTTPGIGLQFETVQRRRHWPGTAPHMTSRRRPRRSPCHQASRLSTIKPSDNLKGYLKSNRATALNKSSSHTCQPPRNSSQDRSTLIRATPHTLLTLPSRSTRPRRSSLQVPLLSGSRKPCLIRRTAVSSVATCLIGLGSSRERVALAMSLQQVEEAWGCLRATWLLAVNSELTCRAGDFSARLIEAAQAYPDGFYVGRLIAITR